MPATPEREHPPSSAHSNPQSASDTNASIDGPMTELNAQGPRPSEKATPPRTGTPLHPSPTDHDGGNANPVIVHQSPLSPSRNHPTQPRTPTARAHPIPMWPNRLHHHHHHRRDQQRISRTHPNPITSPDRTITVISPSSRIRSSNRSGTRRRRPPAASRSCRPSRRSRRRPPCWAAPPRPGATAGRTRCDPDR